MTSQLRTVSVTTSYASLPDLSCSRVSLLNRTGYDMQVRIATETQSNQQITLPNGMSVAVQSTNAKFIQIKSTTNTTGVQLVIEP